jgi:hypothetical protein
LAVLNFFIFFKKKNKKKKSKWPTISKFLAWHLCAWQKRVMLEVSLVLLLCPLKNEVAFKITVELVINYHYWSLIKWWFKKSLHFLGDIRVTHEGLLEILDRKGVEVICNINSSKTGRFVNFSIQRHKEL